MKTYVDSERALTLLFLLIGGSMLAEAYTFGSTAGLFPKLTASIVIGGSILILFQNHLPGPLRTFVAKDIQLIQASEDVQKMTDRAITSSSGETEVADRPLPPSVFTGGFVAAFIVCSYLVGMLWTTPVFVAIYARWFHQPWRYTILVVVLSFAIAYGFSVVLNTPVDSGVLLQTLGVA